ncbi:terminase small subunit [Arenibaculum sp.]|uniref:terminase small subunit n=1 Tax=Arenibaculum sp. TaxID=2865862 RepID=UPI002E1332B5|nr:terminase small subunit [Arenibaculum sp.]
MAVEASLNPRQDLFCTFVAEGTSYAAAARMAGYAPKSSRERGSELMANETVCRRVQELRAQRTAAHASMFDRLEGWLVRLVERAIELDQIANATRAIDRLMQLHPMKNRANARLPAFADAQDEADDLSAALLLDLAEPGSAPIPADAQASAPAVAPAAPVLNRRRRRALQATLRRK